VRAVFEKRRDDASEVERLEHARVLGAPESAAREPDATN